MVEFLDFIINGIKSVANLLDYHSFYIAGLSVSILDLLIGFVCLGIIITVFWKGAHS